MATVQGQYKGQNIYAGSDAEVAAQMRAIDAQSAQTQAPQNPKPIPATSTAPAQQPVAVTPYTPPPSAPPDLKTLEATTAAPYVAEENKLKAEGDSFQQSIENILQKQTTQAARQAELEGQVGIPDLNRSLVEIQNQIRSLNAEAFSATTNAEGRAAPMFAIQGEQERIQRLNSARQYGLAATAQAMQGSLALAQDSIERAMKAEFGGLDAQVNYYKFLLDNNRDKLAQIDEKKAKAFELALAERTEMIANQKEQKSQIYQLAMQAAQTNAPAALISQLLNSQSVDQALMLASQSGIFAPTGEDGFTLSEGQARYDAQGNIIASRGKTSAGGGFGQGISFGTATEANIFNGIVNRYNADPIIKAAERGNALDFYIQQVKSDPASAGNQLNLIYSYIKGLDTDSAVREGEIELVRSIQSYTQAAQNAVERINQGKPVSAQTALELAAGAEKIVQQLRAAAERQQAKYTSQANANPGSISNAWQQFLGGTEQPEAQQQFSYTSIASEADELFPDEQTQEYPSLYSRFMNWLGN